MFVSQKELDIDHKLVLSPFVSFSLYALHKIVGQRKKKKENLWIPPLCCLSQHF